MRGWRAGAVVAVTAAISIGVWLHFPGLNGPDWWQWKWIRRINAPYIALWFAAAALPALIAVAWKTRRALIAVCLSAALLQGVAMSMTPLPAAQRLHMILTDASVTSFPTAAMQLRDLERRAPGFSTAANFDRLLRFFPMHARTKPLLPVYAYVVLLRWFPWVTPWMMGVLIALLTMVTIAAMYAAAREVAGEDAAIVACALLALMPSLALFFPDLDVIYPLFTCGLIASWPRATRGSLGAAVAAGAIVFLLTLTSYALLTVGAFCAIVAIVEMFRPTTKDGVRHVFVAAAVTLGVAIGANVLFALVTGYKPWATFRAALAQQHEILPQLHRPFPASVPFDLLDFVLGSGYVPALAALLWLARRERNRVVRAGLATVVIVAATGLLQAETARVWIFLMPFLAIAAALELVHWGRWSQVAALGAMVIVTISLYVNMSFISERPFVRPPPRIPSPIANSSPRAERTAPAPASASH